MSLDITGLYVQSGGKDVLHDVTFSAAAGQIIAILGSNGAGKSELVLGIAGMLPVRAGRVMAQGVDLTGRAPDAVRAAGIAVVPEGHRVLTKLTVEENLRVAGSLQASTLEVNLHRTYEIFPELAERKLQLAGTLSGGQQQMVALGHALMSNPAYLIIDEMSLGLAPLIVKRLLGVVRDLRDQGVGIVLIEQFTDLALGVADQALVLRAGKSRYYGPAQTLLDAPDKLDEAYFGTGHKRVAV